MTIALLLVCFVAACGDDDDPVHVNNGNGSNNTNNNQSNNQSADECGDPDRDGSTECDFIGGHTCQAGQFCNSEELTCSIGCLSDGDCAGNQFCDLSDGTPGSCVNCTQHPSANNGSGTTNNTTTNNTTTNNTTENYDEGSCEHVCQHSAEICAVNPTQAEMDECYVECQQLLTSDEMACVLEATTCADGGECFDDGGGTINSGTGNSGTGNSGTGEPDDFGDVCDFDSQCQGNKCLFEDEFDMTGYCSAPCEDFTDCPTFWDCDNISGASGRFCIQD